VRKNRLWSVLWTALLLVVMGLGIIWFNTSTVAYAQETQVESPRIPPGPDDYYLQDLNIDSKQVNEIIGDLRDKGYTAFCASSEVVTHTENISEDIKNAIPADMRVDFDSSLKLDNAEGLKSLLWRSEDKPDVDMRTSEYPDQDELKSAPEGLVAAPSFFRQTDAEFQCKQSLHLLEMTKYHCDRLVNPKDCALDADYPNVKDWWPTKALERYHVLSFTCKDYAKPLSELEDQTQLPGDFFTLRNILMYEQKQYFDRMYYPAWLGIKIDVVDDPDQTGGALSKLRFKLKSTLAGNQQDSWEIVPLKMPAGTISNQDAQGDGFFQTGMGQSANSLLPARLQDDLKVELQKQKEENRLASPIVHCNAEDCEPLEEALAWMTVDTINPEQCQPDKNVEYEEVKEVAEVGSVEGKSTIYRVLGGQLDINTSVKEKASSIFSKVGEGLSFLSSVVLGKNTKPAEQPTVTLIMFSNIDPKYGDAAKVREAMESVLASSISNSEEHQDRISEGIRSTQNQPINFEGGGGKAGKVRKPNCVDNPENPDACYEEPGAQANVDDLTVGYPLGLSFYPTQQAVTAGDQNAVLRECEETADNRNEAFILRQCAASSAEDNEELTTDPAEGNSLPGTAPKSCEALYRPQKVTLLPKEKLRDTFCSAARQYRVPGFVLRGLFSIEGGDANDYYLNSGAKTFTPGEQVSCQISSTGDVGPMQINVPVCHGRGPATYAERNLCSFDGKDKGGSEGAIHFAALMLRSKADANGLKAPESQNWTYEQAYRAAGYYNSAKNPCSNEKYDASKVKTQLLKGGNLQIDGKTTQVSYCKYAVEAWDEDSFWRCPGDPTWTDIERKSRPL